jgi:glucokinase
MNVSQPHTPDSVTAIAEQWMARGADVAASLPVQGDVLASLEYGTKVERNMAIGIELTGGQTTIALVDRHGRIHERLGAKTLKGRSAAATLEPYIRAIDALYAHARAQRIAICGIGVSVPGTLDERGNRPQHIPTLPALNGFPLCELLVGRYHVPTRLLVDVDAALLGEHQFGVGRGFRRLLLLKINAVVGAALIIDGQIARSELPSIGHVCHVAVASTAAGGRCSCGKRGCINALVSLDAMQKRVQRALRRGDESSLMRRLLNHEYFSLRLLAEEAGRGDAIALHIYSEVGRWLSAAAAHYLATFEPNILILSGDVLAAGELLLPQIRTALQTPSSARVCSKVEVVRACLGNDAALVGCVVPCFVG